MFKNFRKGMSLLLTLSIVTGSLICGSISVAAAETDLPIYYDFSTTGTDLSTAIKEEKHEGRVVNDALETNDSDATIENGELKIAFDYCSQGVAYNLNQYNFRVKIPYSGLGSDENLRVSFETRDNDGTFNAKWQQFGTLVNSNGNMVIWGRRDTDDSNRWNSGLGGLNQIMLIGYKEKATAYDTTAKPGSTAWNDGVQGGDVNSNYATKGGWAGGTIAGTDKHTICYEIERATDLVTVYVDGQVKGTFYILNELTESGYIDFRGWSNVAANETQYIDNVKIETYKNVTCELPISYDFNTVVPSIGAENTKNLVTAFGTKNKTSETTIENGQLEFYVANGDHGTTDYNAQNLTHYASFLKIPFTGLETGKSLKVSFKYTDGNHNIKWAEFGTLANAEGKTVVGSRRDGESAGRYGTEYGDRTQNLFYGYKTKATTYNTNAVPSTVSAMANFGDLDTSANGKNNNVGYTGANSTKGVQHTIEYIIDADTDLVTVNFDNSEIGTFYAMNPLTSSGSLIFKAWAFTANNDTAYIDDVKVEAYEKAPDPVSETDIPLNYDFAVNIPTIGAAATNAFITSFGGSRNNYPVTSTTTITEEALKFVINDSGDPSVTDYNGINLNNYASGLKIPYTGLKNEENLKVSFRFKDTDGTFNAKWSDFGSLINSNGNTVVWSRRDGDSSGRFGSAWGAKNQVMLVGYKTKVNAYDTAAKPGTTGWNSGSVAPDINTNYASVGAFAGGNVADSQWHTLSYEIDRATDAIVAKLDGEVIGSTMYAINEVTDSGYLWFKAWSGNGNNDEQWIDDVIIETWKPFIVEETNLTATDYVSKTDIALTFSNNLLSTGAEVKAALTIKEKVSGRLVENNRITVSVEDNVATVNVAGGLKYGRTAYVLTVVKDRIKDASGILMAEDYVTEFATKLGESVYIKNYTTPVETATSFATTATVKNPTGAPQKVWILLAVYDSTNNMIGLNTARELNMARGAELTFPLQATYEGTANLVQLLLWNDPDELVPYHIPVVIK